MARAGAETSRKTSQRQQSKDRANIQLACASQCVPDELIDVVSREEFGARPLYLTRLEKSQCAE